LLRLPGFIVAVGVLTAAVLGNTLASDESEFSMASQLLLHRVGALAFALPLLLPWRIFRGRLGWRILLGWLSIDAVVFTSSEINQLVWFFRHRTLDNWATYALPFALLTVAGVWMAVVAALIARNQLEPGRLAGGRSV
jgi:hypothetical protein